MNSCFKIGGGGVAGELNEQTIINQSLDFFKTLLELATFKKGSPRYTKADEKTGLRIIDLVKNGFVIPARIRSLTISEFADVFGKLEKEVDKYANAITEYTGIELINDKYYRIREASIISFLVLVDAMKTLKIIDKIDNPINVLTLREYLYIYLSQLYQLTGSPSKLVEKACRDTCKNLRDYERFETLFTPMALMGLSSGINFDMLLDQGKVNINRKSYMVTGLGLYIINFLKSHQSLQNTLNRASYRDLIINLNNIFSLHKWVVKNITDLVSEAPISIYTQYNGDKSYLVSFLEMDLTSFMLTVIYQYNEMANNLKISPRYLADFPRLEVNNVLNRVLLA